MQGSGFARKRPERAGSAFAINNSTATQVVRRNFDFHAVARHDSNEILPHFAGYVRQDNVTILKFDTELSIRQRFNDGTFDLNGLFFGHKTTSSITQSKQDETTDSRRRRPSQQLGVSPPFWRHGVSIATLNPTSSPPELPDSLLQVRLCLTEP
jgi:hypothetical protein